MSRLIVSVLVVAFLSAFLMACGQQDESVTPEELRTVVQEAVAQAQPAPGSPDISADEIREIVATAVGTALAQTQSALPLQGPSEEEIGEIVAKVIDEALVQAESAPAPAGPSVEEIREIVASSIEERIADIPTADELREMLGGTADSGDGSVVSGKCGMSVGGCDRGRPHSLKDSPELYLWQCQGEGGGSTATCSQVKPVPAVDGNCGTSVDACCSGTFEHMEDTLEFHMWKCRGEGGGDTGNCRLPKIVSGQCSATLNACDAGKFGDLPDTPEHYQWQCQGEGGGVIATCSQSKSGTTTGESGRCGQGLNLCAAGVFGNLADTPDLHKWQCQGEGGGWTATCTQPKSATAEDGIGRCGQTLNSCEGGTFGQLPDTDESYKWQCVGEDEETTETCTLSK